MAFQIFNDGAVIRIENGTQTLLVTKEQVKTIDTIQNNIVRIDIGEGPLKNIFINYQDVTNPVVNSANELRDVIKGWMFSDQYNGGDATEAGQINILNKLGDITFLLEAIEQKEVDLTQVEPSRVDESNPYMIFKGWHRMIGNPDAREWAIQRIRREGDQVIHEWAFGKKHYNQIWNERLGLYYTPYQFEAVQYMPLPDAPLPQEPQILVMEEPQQPVE